MGRPPRPYNRFLLVTRAGTNSLHESWIRPQIERNFDLFVSAYDPRVAPLSGKGLFFERRPGSKVAGYGAFLRERERLWRSYDYVALFDDDLEVDARAINRLFEIVSRNQMKLAQPALTPDSYFTYAALLQHPSFTWRHVNYVEMMCPIFRTDALGEVSPLFDLGYESGIDIIWSNLIARGHQDLAVIDAIPVRHTRRVGSAKAANGFGGGRRYEDDIRNLLDLFGCEWLPCLSYEGVHHDGRRTRNPASGWPDALALGSAIAKRRPIKMRARNIAVYWKHLLTRRPRNMPLAWPEALRRSKV